MSVRVLIADDQALVRGGFRMILDAKDGIEAVGEASDGAEAVALTERFAPRRGADGRADARRRRDRGDAPDRRRRRRGTDHRADHLRRGRVRFAALRAGASGFMLKDVRPPELVDAIRVVARGDTLLAPSVTRQLLDRLVGELPRDGAGAVPDLGELTAREREILRFVALALSNAEIAARLHLTEATVKTQVSAVLRRTSRTQRWSRGAQATVDSIARAARAAVRSPA